MPENPFFEVYEEPIFLIDLVPQPNNPPRLRFGIVY
jgi:hypothetical protein